MRRILRDAEGERRNGLRTTDADLLAEHLVNALARVHDLEGIEARAVDAERELATANEEIEEHEKKIEAIEKDLHEAKAETARLDGYLDEANRRISDMEANAVDLSVAAGKVPHVISSLRSDLAIAGARLNCGMEANERAAYKFCLRADLPGGPCAACLASKAQRENDGLKNSLDVVTHERNQLLIEVQAKGAPVVKAKSAKPADDGTPSLFGLMPVTVTPKHLHHFRMDGKTNDNKGKRRPLTVRDCGCGGKGRHRAACEAKRKVATT